MAAQHEPGPEPAGPRPIRGIPLGRWAGVAMSAHWTVLFTLALFADLLAATALPSARPHHTAAAYWAVGVLTAAVFLATVLAHELAHAVVARHYGMRVRSITLWMLGGVTELDGDPPSPRADIVIAVAGPATSVALGVATGAVAWAVGGSGLVGAALVWLAGMSVLLGIFNLLPAPPLDGGRVLRGVLWWRYRDRGRAVAAAGRSGRVLGLVLVALGMLEVLTGNLAGLWLALIGWFIVNSAASETASGAVQALAGLTVGQIMQPAPPAVSDWCTVEQFVARLTPEAAARAVFVLVDFGGDVSGVVRLQDLERVPAAQRAELRVRDVYRRGRVSPLTVTPDAAVADVVRQLPAHGGVAVVVDGQRRPVGLVTVADVARVSRLVQLGWHGPDRADGSGGGGQDAEPRIPARA